MQYKQKKLAHAALEKYNFDLNKYIDDEVIPHCVLLKYYYIILIKRHILVRVT